MGCLQFSKEQKIWELRLTAKWATDEKEKLKAIYELTTYGEPALQTLEELLSITAYDDIKKACIAAIKSIKEKENHKELDQEREHEQEQHEDTEIVAAKEGDHEVAPLADLLNTLIDRKKL